MICLPIPVSYGILNPWKIDILGSIYHMVFWPWVQYTIWYCDPGVKFLSLYFEPHHGKLNPPPIYVKRGGSIYHGWGVQNTMDENRPQGQYTMGFKIPYDTGIKESTIVFKSKPLHIFRYILMTSLI